jgi:hypothetical protein
MMEEWWLRVANNLVGRLDGPLHIRFVLQPLMSLLLAIRDGMRDARSGNPAFLWAVFTGHGARRVLLLNGWKGVGRVVLLALGLDVIYQILAFRKLYPLEALLTAALLAIVPYILLRGPINRIARVVTRNRAFRRAGTARSWCGPEYPHP